MKTENFVVVVDDHDGLDDEADHDALDADAAHDGLDGAAEHDDLEIDVGFLVEVESQETRRLVSSAGLQSIMLETVLTKFIKLRILWEKGSQRTVIMGPTAII